MSQSGVSAEEIVLQRFSDHAGIWRGILDLLATGFDDQTLAEDDPFADIAKNLAQTACQLRQSLTSAMQRELFDPHDAEQDTPLSPEARVVFSALLQDGMFDMVRARKELAAYQSLRRGSPILMLSREVDDHRYLGYNVAGRLLNTPDIKLVKQPFSGGKADYRREPQVVYPLVGGCKVFGDWCDLNPTAYGSFQQPAVLVGEALQRWLIAWASRSKIKSRDPDSLGMAQILDELAFLSPLGNVLDETKDVGVIKERALLYAPDLAMWRAQDIPKQLDKAIDHHWTNSLKRILKAVRILDPDTLELVLNTIVPTLHRPVYLHIVEQAIYGYDPSITDPYDPSNHKARGRAIADLAARNSKDQ